MLYSAFANKGAADVLPRVNGDFNLIWHDNTDDTIHMVRNPGRPYTFAKIKGQNTIIGASEKGMLKWLVKRHGFEIQFCWDPIEYTEYVFDFEEPDGLTKPEMIKHERYVAPVVAHRPPKQQDLKGSGLKGVEVAKSNQLEFFLDSYSRSYSAAISFYGWDYDGVEVEIPNSHDGEFALDRWYVGVAYWDGSNGGRWRVNPLSVKAHPVEVEEDKGNIHVCILCGDDHHENGVLFMDNAPICYGCADQGNIKATQFDAGQENKVAEYTEGQRTYQ